jgi:hypothetical protein
VRDVERVSEDREEDDVRDKEGGDKSLIDVSPSMLLIESN